MSKLERRFITVPVSLRMEGADDNVLYGLAARHYDGTPYTMSQDLGGFRERLAHGCFTRALSKGNDIACLVSHDQDKLLGRTTSGTCRVWEEKDGLHYRCALPDTSYARDLRASVMRGDMSGSSFGFEVDPDDDGEDMWSKERDGNGDLYACRTVIRVSKLLDCSPTFSPAYLATAAAVRDLFPEGVPASFRNMGGAVSELISFQRQQRRQFSKTILGL